jgi:hypothetical protein
MSSFSYTSLLRDQDDQDKGEHAQATRLEHLEDEAKQTESNRSMDLSIIDDLSSRILDLQAKNKALQLTVNANAAHQVQAQVKTMQTFREIKLKVEALHARDLKAALAKQQAEFDELLGKAPSGILAAKIQAEVAEMKELYRDEVTRMHTMCKKDGDSLKEAFELCSGASLRAIDELRIENNMLLAILEHKTTKDAKDASHAKDVKDAETGYNKIQRSKTSLRASPYF